MTPWLLKLNEMKKLGKKEKEMVEKYQPYTPTQDDLNKLQELFEKKYNQKIETNEPVIDTVDEPVIEPQINRLVYSKDV